MRNSWTILKCGAGEGWWRSRKWERNEVLQWIKEERNILYRLKRRKAIQIRHIWGRNCLLKHTTEGQIEGRIEGRENEE